MVVCQYICINIEYSQYLYRYSACERISRVQEVLVISPDKPGGPKRYITNIGVNPIPPIWCPPWAPLSQLCLHVIDKTSSRKADQSARPVNATVRTGAIQDFSKGGQKI